MNRDEFIEIELDTAEELGRITTRLEIRMKGVIDDLDFEEFYDLAADWFGTNDPDVKALLDGLQQVGIL